MADEDVLSDEEIEALLDEGESGDEDAGESLPLEELETVFRNVSSEIEEILSNVLSRDVRNEMIDSQVLRPDDIPDERFESSWIVVESSMQGEFEGLSRYLLPESEALVMADIMMGQDGEDPPDSFDDVYKSAISEMFNQVVSSLADQIQQVTGLSVDLQPPETRVLSMEEFLDSIDVDEFFWVTYSLGVEDLFDTEILFEMQPLEALKQIASGEPSAEDDEPEDPSTESSPSSSQPSMETQERVTTESGSKKDVKSVQFPQFESAEGEEPVGNINMLMDVPMEVAVELGRTTLQVKEILNLGQGSIIELDRLAGEPVDLLVNGRLVARGEVVVIDENFGVRVTSIVSPMERIK